MPVHDWTRVSAGTFHHFHNLWVGDLCKALNGGILPHGFYALGEQIACEIGPDGLALQPLVSASPFLGQPGNSSKAPEGAIAVDEAPPRVQLCTPLDRETLLYARRQRTIVIRHTSGHRVTALIEIISPGNRGSQRELSDLLNKLVGAIQQSCHLLIIDLFPPNRVVPGGVYGALLEALGGEPYVAPRDRPLTIAACAAGPAPRAYAEPVGVGGPLCEMPLFLSPDWYVNVPLESTYAAAWTGVPSFWQSVLEGRTDHIAD